MFTATKLTTLLELYPAITTLVDIQSAPKIRVVRADPKHRLPRWRRLEIHPQSHRPRLPEPRRHLQRQSPLRHQPPLLPLRQQWFRLVGQHSLQMMSGAELFEQALHLQPAKYPPQGPRNAMHGLSLKARRQAAAQNRLALLRTRPIRPRSPPPKYLQRLGCSLAGGSLLHHTRRTAQAKKNAEKSWPTSLQAAISATRYKARIHLHGSSRTRFP